MSAQNDVDLYSQLQTDDTGFLAMFAHLVIDLYSPLRADEMRVLALHPGTGTEIIECHLEHQKRDAYACTPYEALSYTWGPPRPSWHILLNGQRIKARQNLWYALSRLRNESSVRYLWVDALCINQVRSFTH